MPSLFGPTMRQTSILRIVPARPRHKAATGAGLPDTPLRPCIYNSIVLEWRQDKLEALNIFSKGIAIKLYLKSKLFYKAARVPRMKRQKSISKP
jgi:hypothetical protein